ncbi:MAG: ribosomal RNA small subunit methyltransferase A [Euryarchaeota archaeon]|nr:ribosomal RNA small subunit methyltransferase A [Euryarchaeota archaeon]
MDDLDARLLVDLLRDRITPDKSLGQHFLLDESVIARSIQLPSEHGSPVNQESHVLEVGPGPGSLTLGLLRSGAKVTALEIDKEAVEHLRRVFTTNESQLTLVNEDALKAHWPDDITHVIANIPYSISSPLLERIQRYHSETTLRSVVLLVQEEFAEKMSMKGGPANSGPLGLSLWLDFEVLIDVKVPSSSFSPSPSVNSRLILLRPTERPEVSPIFDRRLFRTITQHCFANRRRKMRTLFSTPPRRISRVRGWHKERWNETSKAILESQITELPLDWQNLRPENLETYHWVILSDKFSSFTP